MAITVTLTNRQHGTEVCVQGDDAEECAETYNALVEQFKGVGGYKGGADPSPKANGGDIAKYEAIRAARARRANRDASRS